jgi:hypothetical protein
MPLDPELASLLDEMAADPSRVAPTETDVMGARQTHEADAERFTPADLRAFVASVSDIDVAGPAGSLRGRRRAVHAAYPARMSSAAAVCYRAGLTRRAERALALGVRAHR